MYPQCVGLYMSHTSAVYELLLFKPHCLCIVFTISDEAHLCLLRSLSIQTTQHFALALVARPVHRTSLCKTGAPTKQKKKIKTQSTYFNQIRMSKRFTLLNSVSFEFHFTFRAKLLDLGAKQDVFEVNNRPTLKAGRQQLLYILGVE